MKKKSKRHVVALGSLFAISALLVGCGDEPVALDKGNSAESFDTTQLPPSSLFQGTYALPLDGIVAPATEDEHTRENALSQHISKCMAEKGFEYSSNNGYTQTGTKSYYYGITSVPEASVYGYRRPVEPGTEHLATEVDRPEEEGASGLEPAPPGSGPSAEYYLALSGNQNEWIPVEDETTGAVVANYDPDSCWGKAMDELQPQWGQRYALETTAQELSRNAYLDSLNSKVVVDGITAWSTCMDGQGYDYADPDSASESSMQGDVPGVEEIKTAVADAECKESTGLNKIWSGEIARLQTVALNEYPGFLEQWNEILQAELDAARGVK